MHNNKDDSFQGFRALCGEHGLRATPQRMAVYRELMTARDHPSAETIYRRVKEGFPSISFDTVNRTLLTFASLGVADVVEGFGDARRFDPEIRSHHHLLCVRCRRIVDIHHEAYDALPIPPKAAHGFKILSKRVVLRGICSRCQNGGAG